MAFKSASRIRSGPGAVSLPSPLRGSQDSRRTIMSSSLSFLFTFMFLACAVTPAAAQTNKIFQWQFSQSLSQSLPSCRALPIEVSPFTSGNKTLGVPPYYMMSFPINNMGTPHPTLIGTGQTGLSWTVDQPIGAEMLLYVVDSTGSSGGVPPQTFTVVAGTHRQCGTPPYNVTLAAIDSPVVTNVTMGPDDDVFTFIDRANPDTILIAGISDLTGQWATGTASVKTTGSNDVSCTGLVSSSNTKAVIAQEEAQAASSTKARKQSAVIAGVVVTIVVLLLLGGAGVYLYLRRRRMMARSDKVTPRQFESGTANVNLAPSYSEANTHILSINSFINNDNTTEVKSPTVSTFSSPTNTSGPGTLAGFDRQRMIGSMRAQSDNASVSSAPSAAPPHGGLSVRNPSRSAASFTNFPTASVRRSAKSIEASMPSVVSEDSEFYDGATTSRPMQRSLSAGPAATLGRAVSPARSASVGDPVMQEEIIIQHQDGGAIVRELPPPYMGQPEDQP
uniref:Uncharacterized protein n=1 Tax=Mycena chlorophos TaxID=658473 RepID=A0ABQ0LTF3_MYCCL|nr:predicted protein [Mycena chlorophos]